MCMLSYYPSGIMPDADRLWNGAIANPDGYGYALVNRHRCIEVFRSLDPDEAISRFLEARARDLAGPAMFHSRLATSGKVDLGGCHPHRVGNDPRTVVGHNGILFMTEGSESDTAIFARQILPAYTPLDSRRRMRRLAGRIGEANKLVILTVNPAYRKSAYLVNEQAGVWVEGEWHSNNGWRPPAPVRAVVGWDDDDWPVSSREPWPCDLCGATYAVDSETLVCAVCLACNDCHQYRDDCLCDRIKVSSHTTWCSCTGGDSPCWGEPARGESRCDRCLASTGAHSHKPTAAESAAVFLSQVPERLALPAGRDLT